MPKFNTYRELAKIDESRLRRRLKKLQDKKWKLYIGDLSTRDNHDYHSRMDQLGDEIKLIHIVLQAQQRYTEDQQKGTPNDLPIENPGKD